MVPSVNNFWISNICVVVSSIFHFFCSYYISCCNSFIFIILICYFSLSFSFFSFLLLLNIYNHSYLFQVVICNYKRKTTGQIAAVTLLASKHFGQFSTFVFSYFILFHFSVSYFLLSFAFYFKNNNSGACSL